MLKGQKRLQTSKKGRTEIVYPLRSIGKKKIGIAQCGKNIMVFITVRGVADVYHGLMHAECKMLYLTPLIQPSQQTCEVGIISVFTGKPIKAYRGLQRSSPRSPGLEWT